jgi:hypothetical protein
MKIIHRFLLTCFVLSCQTVYSQLPAGKWYAVYDGDKGAMLTVEQTSITLSGGSPQFDAKNKQIVIFDSTHKGQKIEVVKVLSTLPSGTKVVGKAVEAGKDPVYIIVALARIDTGILEFHFQRDEYPSQTEAETHANDSTVVVPFRFLSADLVRHSMSLKHLSLFTPTEMIAAMRSSNDSLNALQYRLKDQPEAAMFAMFIAPPHIMQQELIRRGYNPFIPQPEVDAIFAKLKEDPEVIKVMEELQKQQE